MTPVACRVTLGAYDKLLSKAARQEDSWTWGISRLAWL